MGPAMEQIRRCDCSSLPQGDDMKLNPSGLPEGQAIKCDASQAEVYRLVGGKRCWYPNPTVATSWDAQWSKFLIVDCSSLPKGDDMKLNPKDLPDGQAIKCDASQAEVYRIVSGKRCWYPNPTIATSWDAQWSKFLVVDCTSLPKGDDMKLNPKDLPDGQAIKCDASAPEVYRLTAGGKYRWYPNPTIASSWDTTWSTTFVVVDCTLLTKGDDLCVNPKTLPDGQAIKCSASAPEVYRLVAGGSYRWYPNPTIATSWDVTWSTTAVVVDCSVIAKGDDLFQNPNNLPDGAPIKCEKKPEIYRIDLGKRRLYPDLVIAKSWDVDCDTKAIQVDCSVLPAGDNMCFNQPPLTNGQALRCVGPDTNKVFRFCDGLIRWYPNPVIADSWDPTWKNAVLADCSKFLTGPDLALKTSASAY